MSTSSDQFINPIQIPVKAFEYPCAQSTSSLRDARPGKLEMPAHDSDVTVITANDLAAAYEKGQQEARRECDRLFREQLTQAVSSERIQVGKVVAEFQQSTSEYYSKVEDQLVQLALGIAAKILHREAQVDPLLVAALVKLATENLKQGSKIEVNIRPEDIDSWQSYFEQDGNGRIQIELIEDPTLSPGECIVHSEVGVAALGINTQLKEIERGLFDLLAQRPKNE